MFGPRLDCNHTVDGKPLQLIPITKEMLPDCLKLLEDPEVTRFLTMQDYSPTLEDEIDWFIRKGKDDSTRGWAIVLGEAENQEYIGGTGISSIDWRLRTASTGIMIAKKYWRKGVATAVMQRRAQFAFEVLNLMALETHICILNEGSWRAAEKAGYQKWGEKPHAFFDGGTYYPAWKGSITRERWEELKKG